MYEFEKKSIDAMFKFYGYEGADFIDVENGFIFWWKGAWRGYSELGALGDFKPLHTMRDDVKIKFYEGFCRLVESMKIKRDERGFVAEVI